MPDVKRNLQLRASTLSELRGVYNNRNVLKNGIPTLLRKQIQNIVMHITFAVLLFLQLN